MNPRRLCPVVLPVVLALILCVTPAGAATELAPSKAIPAHPSDLSYGPLRFEVPDGDAYRHQLKNGIPVYVAEDHALPLVHLEVKLRVGSFLEPVDKIGLADLTASMMRQGGTEALSAEEFDERVDFIATQMGAFVEETSGGAFLNAITPAFTDSLNLFFEMMKRPAFQESRLAVERSDLLEEMKQRNDRPASISNREWGWLIRGHDHFLSRQPTDATLAAIDREDLIAFHAKYWRPENMIISIAGDVDTAEVLAELNKRFEGWDVDGPEVPWPPPAPSHTPRPGVYYVEKDIPQGRVVIGQLGMERKNWDDSEAFAMSVMNDILGGGGFTSRLVKRIRSDEGLAYSAGSRNDVGEWWPGEFSMRYQSKSPTVAYAAQIAFDEVKRIRSEPVSQEELTVAKSSFVEVFPRRFESPRKVVQTFADDEYIGRPHSYWKSYQAKIREVSTKDVQRVAKKYLDPDRMVFLVVGKWEDVQPGDPDGRASMAEFFEGEVTRIPTRDPLTLEARDEGVE
jgi:zinc protease